MRRPLSVLAVLVTITSASAQQVRDYAWFISRLTDLDALPMLEPGTTCKQFSSWDRASLDPKRWDANGDAGQYETYDPMKHGPVPLKEGEALMAQMQGPGCIFRIWSANPQGKIRFYLDGATDPTYEFDFDRLFRGEYDDFQKPFVYKQGAVQSASDCYLPIPYAKSCRVTADKRHRQYYHIGYMTYPEGTQVETFRWPLDEKAKAACAEAARKWLRCGDDPRPPAEGDALLDKQVTLQPNEPLMLAELQGPGAIKAFRAKLEGQERYVWRKVLLRMWFDDERQPCVLCPLGEFFGTGWQPNEYRSYPLGVIDGAGYCYWTMPFRKLAKVEVLHRGVGPVALSFSLKWQQLEALPDNAALFHAKWRREAPSRVFDYPILEATGQGRFVGVGLYINHPVPGWWGEGDEKVWVDGESFPSTFGTGSEDYFGHAWGMQYDQAPSFGCSLLKGDRSCPYRWHISDHIPFSTSYRMTIENYAPYADDYTTVAYWYQMPGGSDFFQPDTADDWRPWGRSMPNSVEAEDLWFDRLGDTIGLVSDEDRATEFSHGMGVDFGFRRSTDLTPAGELSIEQRGIYYPTAYVFEPEAGREIGLFELVVDGATLRPLDDRRREGLITFEGALLGAGPHSIALRCVEDGPLGLDCLRLDPCPRVRNALEAETLTPFEVKDGTLDTEIARLPWSGGAQLRFLAEGPGSSVTLEIPGTDAVPANVSLLLTTGPDGGDVQARWLGQPVGEPVSLYTDRPGTRAVPLGQLDLPAQRRLLTLEVVGKATDSAGFQVGLDYILLEKVLYPGAVEAETARIIEARGGGTGPQRNEGMVGLSGHTHLFFTNSQPDGYVDLEFAVPRDGTYEASAWFSHSHDYAIVQVSVDGSPVGEPLDLYAPGWVYGGEARLGQVALTAGKHVMRFQSVGKNEKSGGYFMGIDCFRLK